MVLQISKVCSYYFIISIYASIKCTYKKHANRWWFIGTKIFIFSSCSLGISRHLNSYQQNRSCASSNPFYKFLKILSSFLVNFLQDSWTFSRIPGECFLSKIASSVLAWNSCPLWGGLGKRKTKQNKKNWSDNLSIFLIPLVVESTGLYIFYRHPNPAFPGNV